MFTVQVQSPVTVNGNNPGYNYNGYGYNGYTGLNGYAAYGGGCTPCDPNGGYLNGYGYGK